ncbi:MAG: hypothetical protein GQ583_05090 [Methyloprofundus sp.]|nr:hypothetical protein [Methyloprofundus sp.]
MSKKIRITVKSDKDEAEVLKQKLILKGYSVQISSCKAALLDGTDLGGHYHYLTDIDGEMFVVIAKK